MAHPNQAAVVRHPHLPGVLVTLDPATDYDVNDIIVRTYPDFFKKVVDGDRIIESVSVEDATAEPGRKRSRAAK